ncbi:hypothetical protein TgHK011_009745 [Trichoderma gracile]|nr:hypothetical protein TgHK011_009745 [Trichoderma gracile]
MGVKMGEIFPQSHALNLSMVMTSAQTKGELCDLELICYGEAIMVHKLVACLQSPVMKAACTGSFKEASGRYEMKDCAFASVRRMVQFFYNGDYNAKSSKDEATEEMFVHVAMFRLADKYLIDGLRTLSQIKFRAGPQEAGQAQHDAAVRPARVRPRLRSVHREAPRRSWSRAVRLRVTALPFDRLVKEILDGLMSEFPEFARDLAMSYIEQPQYTTGLFAGGGINKNLDATTTAHKFPWVSSAPSSTIFGEAVDKKDGDAKKGG